MDAWYLLEDKTSELRRPPGGLLGITVVVHNVDIFRVSVLGIVLNLNCMHPFADGLVNSLKNVVDRLRGRILVVNWIIVGIIGGNLASIANGHGPWVHGILGVRATIDKSVAIVVNRFGLP